jgi:hypothetical protein
MGRWVSPLQSCVVCVLSRLVVCRRRSSDAFGGKVKAESRSEVASEVDCIHHLTPECKLEMNLACRKVKAVEIFPHQTVLI